jgi:hypothetical protein
MTPSTLYSKAVSTYLLCFTAVLSTFSITRAAYQDDIGLYDMRTRDASLTGTGVTVGQVEAGIGTQFDGSGNIIDEGAWQTDPFNMALNSGIFTYFTTATPYPTGANFDSSRESGHANTVGGRYFADPSAADGVAPGVDAINVFYANYFYNSLIQTSTDISSPIINQSFVFGSTNNTVDQNYDNYAANYGVLFCNGVNTNTTTATIPSPASSYNGISVSAVNRSIASLADGRSKPDIVAPGSSAASYTTPLVSGAAAVLYQSGQREDAGPGTASDATDPRTLKALLLNSAIKPAGWSHSSTHPLDTINGAGILEVNNAQLQLAAGKYSPTQDEVLSEADTTHLPPSGETGSIASYSGWNLGSVTNTADSGGNPANHKQYDVTDHYFFDLSSADAAAFYLTSTLVWNRQSGRSSINNLDLFLYKADGTLVAESISSVDNVEHLYERHLAPGQYVLQVHKPYNDGRITNGETYTLAFNFTPSPAPGAPGSLSATAISASEIDLSWTDTSDDETGYRVERRPSGGTYSTIATLAADSTVYSDNSLASGTTYEYQVTTFNAEAETSSTASATTLSAAPDAPSDANSTAISTNAIDLTWTDNSSNEDEFLIERRLSGGSYADLVTLAANTTAYSDTGLTDGTLYEYRITAYNTSGSSTAVTASDATLLAPPTAAGTTTISDSEIQISWVDSSASEEGYSIERRLTGDATYSILTTVAANTEFYNDTALATETGYDYRITATNSTGDSSSIETSGSTYSQIEDWRLTYFETTSATGDAADDADPEFDGLVNLMEYATGSHPLESSTHPVDSELLGSTHQFSFTWRTNSELDFSIGYSEDLIAGFTYYSSSTIDTDSNPDLEFISSDPIDSEFETLTYSVRDAVTSDTVFIQLQINMP